MLFRDIRYSIFISILMIFLNSCANPNPQPVGLTPIPALAQGARVTLVAAIIESQPTSEQLPAEMKQGQATLGAAIYFEHCSTCHGVQGEGIDAPPLRNNQYIQPQNDQDIFNTIVKGRSDTEMPAWSQANGGPLTSEQISSVVVYLHSLQGVVSLPTATPLPPPPTEAPLPTNAPTPEPARPSNSGEAGPAVAIAGDVSKGELGFGLDCAACHGPAGIEGMGLPNPGSDDGIVPGLNPIDPTLVNQDKKAFAMNLDLFIEHGSVPSGPNPMIMMPAFGDGQLLSAQQIADIIAYLMSLNSM